MTKRGVLEESKNYIMNTYASFPIVLKEGKGVYVWDEDGKKYLDCVDRKSVV